MEQYRVTCENTTRNLGWFEDKKQAITFCEKNEKAKYVFLYLGETNLAVYEKQ